MSGRGSKKRKPYKKPSYQAEEILEKMSLACHKATGYPCKAARPACVSGNLLT